MIDLYNKVGAKLYISAENTAEKLIKKIAKSSFMIGVIGFASPAFAQSNGVQGILDDGATTIKGIIDFIMIVAVLMGVGGILYGLKLIMDKSNDRENVKNSHIAFSLVGGAFLLVLWFVVSALGETAGGGTIGKAANF